MYHALCDSKFFSSQLWLTYGIQAPGTTCCAPTKRTLRIFFRLFTCHFVASFRMTRLIILYSLLFFNSCPRNRLKLNEPRRGNEYCIRLIYPKNIAAYIPYPKFTLSLHFSISQAFLSAAFFSLKESGD